MRENSLAIESVNIFKGQEERWKTYPLITQAAAVVTEDGESLPDVLANIKAIAESSGGGEKGEKGADGKSAYELWLDEGNSGSVEDFLSSLKGEPGEPGADGYTPIKGTDYADGTAGESAYEIAVRSGFTGTESEWLLSLKGESGPSGGVTSPISGFFTMHVDAEGNLYVVTADAGVNPIRYDAETGDLYYKVS